MNQLIYRLKKLLKDIREDFKNPVSVKTENKNCCSATALYSEDDLRPRLTRVIQQQNNVKSKNNQ
ncbi:hypothetical protein RM549_14255 [Salegentibacter sp. F188]|uniref:Uncharacterized protein n=1 Tax=Autumnicola patrickiae TaxID=3075591 RepID=A0ABU3E4N0_9FLAO|nr:hypothetical protein [Salegentibacter sp. F188]MDT0690956.1 hypothetical protein [Salegentibacter sp. F188]